MIRKQDEFSDADKELLALDDFISMQEYAPAWLEYLGIESWEDIAKMRKDRTWPYPDYMMLSPPADGRHE